MTDVDVISLSSDSSRPSSPFFNVSELFNDTKECQPLVPPSDLNVNESHKMKDIATKSLPVNYSPIKNRIMHTLSDSDHSETELPSNISVDKEYDNLWKKYGKGRHNTLLLNETAYPILCDDGPSTSRKRENLNRIKAEPKISSKREKDEKIQNKEHRMQEKTRKQREKEMKRAEKQGKQELQKQMKPGVCTKYMTVVLDSSLVTCSFGGTLMAAIQNSESKCEVSTQTVPFSISWTRELPGATVKEENHLVVIWQWQLVIPAIKSHTLCSQIQAVQAQCPSKSVSLVIYGLNGYFSYLKSKRRKGSVEPPKAKKGKRSPESEKFPYLKRIEIEEELIELQVLANCSHRLIESQEELGQLIVQITKAIAETPFKLDKQKRELENLEWFAVGDSRDCVTVDKAGNGLLRLWQQQLCQFNKAGHDVAQAIAAVYQSPVSLVQAYDKCSSKKEAEEVLKDIPVRRCQGPLSSSRRIGPELSKKIYTFFCSTDGDTPLSQEQ